MGVFFGTDGIRGKVNSELTFDLAYKCGNALAITLDKPTILIGCDTRTSGSYLTLAFASGALSAGANVVDIGVCPTAGIAYLTKRLGFDYGVVVSASHNPAEYNGIKIFDENGFKLGDERENALERKFVHTFFASPARIGIYKQNYKLVKLYEDYLVSCCSKGLNGLKVVLDASNGASFNVAPKVFKTLGACVIKTSCKNDGANINNNCGSLYPETLRKKVILNKANLGFAFDGDSDRIIACDENGDILDGDMIIYMLAKYLKSKNVLAKNTVVGTRHTNMGIQKDLMSLGIKLERTDIGDKYVLEKLNKDNLNLGGEKSGHIILRDYATTGDGVLTAIKISEMVCKLNTPLSNLAKVNLYPQCNIDCVVSDKMRVINSEILTNAINKEEAKLGNDSRVMVRVSGTESKVRIMVEALDNDSAQKSATYLSEIVAKIDKKEL